MAGRVVDSAVSHVDLFPTILDAVGAFAPKRVHGQSLLPLMTGEAGDSERSVYTESLYPLLHYGWAPLRAVRTGKLKLISAPRPEVFDVKTDPRESLNLAGGNPELVEDLEARLGELRGDDRDGDPDGRRRTRDGPGDPRATPGAGLRRRTGRREPRGGS